MYLRIKIIIIIVVIEGRKKKKKKLEKNRFVTALFIELVFNSSITYTIVWADTSNVIVFYTIAISDCVSRRDSCIAE